MSILRTRQEKAGSRREFEGLPVEHVELGVTPENPMIQHSEVKMGIPALIQRSIDIPNEIKGKFDEIVDPPERVVDKHDNGHNTFRVVKRRRGRQVVTDYNLDTYGGYLVSKGRDPDDIPPGLFRLNMDELYGKVAESQQRIIEYYSNLK